MPCSPYRGIRSCREQSRGRLLTETVPSISNALCIIRDTHALTASYSSGLCGLYMTAWWKFPSPTWPRTVEKRPRLLDSVLDSSVHGSLRLRDSLDRFGGVDLPTISASREIGTATSVDQISVPSGLTARMAQRDCFLAAQRLSPSSRELAKTSSLLLLWLRMVRVRWMLSVIPARVPVNLGVLVDC